MKFFAIRYTLYIAKCKGNKNKVKVLGSITKPVKFLNIDTRVPSFALSNPISINLSNNYSNPETIDPTARFKITLLPLR